jgi:hypothetical protein
MTSFRILPGLFSSETPATPVPPSWGHLAREGYIVEFTDSAGASWTANFRPGLGGLNEVRLHPDQRSVLVFADGAMWTVDPDLRTADMVSGAIEALWEADGGLILSRQGLGFIRIGASGIAWRTRRLSWDGFKDVHISANELTAMAWSPFLGGQWIPCVVNLETGRAQGGSYTDSDGDDWEVLAPEGFSL